LSGGKQYNPATLSDEAARNLLHDLVVIPSPSHHEADAAQFLVDWMVAHGYHRAYRDKAGNAVGIIGDGQQEVVLLGHIDTFPGSPPVRLHGHKLYGRGTVDAKGPLCAFAAAAARVTVPEDARLIVIGAVEEEAATSKGARYAATQFNPQVCIIGEPSSWDRITLGYKGRLLLDWEWMGALAHSAGPVLSPAERAVAYWQQVQCYVARYNQGREQLFVRLDVSLRGINTSQDGAHGTARMTIGFRLPPDLTPGEVESQFLPDDDTNVRFYGAERAFVADKDTVLSRALRVSIRAQGGQPRFVHKTGTSDMNVVGPIWRCPIVAYGPGDSSLDHTPDEHIDLDEYLAAISVLERALCQLFDADR
jgi:[amino group carrier protein]-lysine/ornithine hydrolase